MNDDAHAVFSVVVELDVLVESGEVTGGVAREGDGPASKARSATGAPPPPPPQPVASPPAASSRPQLSPLSSRTAIESRQPRVHASRYDSVADIKRELQERYGEDWGLLGRALDRDGVAVGWELVHNATVLCPNYLLGDYAVASGDTVEAVVRLYDEEQDE